MLVLLRRTSFLDTFKVLYFSQLYTLQLQVYASVWNCKVILSPALCLESHTGFFWHPSCKVSLLATYLNNITEFLSMLYFELVNDKLNYNDIYSHFIKLDWCLGFGMHPLHAPNPTLPICPQEWATLLKSLFLWCFSMDDVGLQVLIMSYTFLTKVWGSFWPEWP